MTAAGDKASRPAAGRVVSIGLDDVPVREERGASIQVLVSPKTAGQTTYIFGRAELAPGAIDSAHAHDYGEETIFVLQGQGFLRAGDEEIPLAAGSCVFIPRGTVHSVHNTGADTIVAVFANGPLAPRPELGHRNTTTE